MASGSMHLPMPSKMAFRESSTMKPLSNGSFHVRFQVRQKFRKRSRFNISQNLNCAISIRLQYYTVLLRAWMPGKTLDCQLTSVLTLIGIQEQFSEQELQVAKNGVNVFIKLTICRCGVLAARRWHKQ